MEKINALLLIGHSYSGKTPLGERIEQESGRFPLRFHHFDFGEHLRMAGRNGIENLPGNDATGYIRSILDGTLLDDEHFFIAASLLTRFLALRNFRAASDILVLNGLPRTAGQARDIALYGIEVRMVLHCSCSIEHAYARKMMADRGEGHEERRGRTDNSMETFFGKIQSFERQTHPLIDYYAARGAQTVTIRVIDTTTHLEAFRAAETSLSRLWRHSESIIVK